MRPNRTRSGLTWNAFAVSASSEKLLNRNRTPAPDERPTIDNPPKGDLFDDQNDRDEKSPANYAGLFFLVLQRRISLP